MTHAEILKLWPSVADLADDMRKPRSTVNNWIGRNRVPMEYWVQLVDAATSRDIPLTYGHLAKGVAKGGGGMSWADTVDRLGSAPSSPPT